MQTRRDFLRHSFHFSAAALLAAGLPEGAGAQAPPAAGHADSCHFLAIGDFGVKEKEIARQKAVADGMAKYAAAAHFHSTALLLLGDNFYGGLAGKGVKSSRWASGIEAMYPSSAFDCPLYAILGNHDYNDEKNTASAKAQLAYRRENPASRWTMPAKWYSFELASPRGQPLASVLALDTNLITGEKGASAEERKGQLAWLAASLALPRTAPWRMVIGHHPVYSDGSHGDARAMAREIEPLLRKYKVDLYMSGHDHDLQHLEIKDHPTSFVVSGAGGARARDIRDPKEILHDQEKAGLKKAGDGGSVEQAIASSAKTIKRPKPRGPFWQPVYGFTHLELTPDQLAVRHVDANGKKLHGFTKSRAGKVEVG